MFEYTICNQPDKNIFTKQCKALESHIPDIVKGKMLDDIDGSQTQIYAVKGKKVTIHNSYYVGAVYIQSEIELTHFFNKNAL